MIEILEFVFGNFWRFTGCAIIFFVVAWWSVVLVASFKPVVISMNHVYNDRFPGELGEDDEENFLD